MYARPPDAAPIAASPTAFNAPLAALCCLGLILFLIATTIVLALIPIYIPTKDVTAGDTNDYYFLMDPNESLGNDGNLDSSSQTTIANAISSELGFESNALEFDGNVVAGPSDSRRRRSGTQSRTRRDFPAQSCRGIGHFKRQYCRGLCIIRSSDFYITVTITYGGVEMTRQFRVRLYTNAIAFPATRGSTTVTTTTIETTETSADLG